MNAPANVEDGGTSGQDEQFSLGYLMGLIVGEGSFTTGPRLSVKLHFEDPEPLRALQERFGGKIYGPYKIMLKSGRESAFLSWELYGHALWWALPIFDEFLPPSKKRNQYERWLEKFHLEFGNRPRRTLKVGAARVEALRAMVQEPKENWDEPLPRFPEIKQLPIAPAKTQRRYRFQFFVPPSVQEQRARARRARRKNA